MVMMTQHFILRYDHNLQLERVLHVLSYAVKIQKCCYINANDESVLNSATSSQFPSLFSYLY